MKTDAVRAETEIEANEKETPSSKENVNDSESATANKYLSLPGRGLMMAKQRTSFGNIGYVSREQKRILKGISLYFNPGELIGIMGPSGMANFDCMWGHYNFTMA